MNSLQERLSRAFDPSKHTKKGLSVAAKVSAPSVTDWFNGKTKELKGEPLVRAARYLGVDPLWLATGQGPMQAVNVPWPFMEIAPEAWQSLNEREKGRIEGIIYASMTRASGDSSPENLQKVASGKR
jgi:antitoxin HigA-1